MVKKYPKPNSSKSKSNNHSGGVEVTEDRGEDSAAKDGSKNGKNIFDIVYTIYQSPVLSVIEIHLWKTREHYRKEKHECLHEFKKNHPIRYAGVMIVDIVIAVAFVIAFLAVILALADAIYHGAVKLEQLV